MKNYLRQAESLLGHFKPLDLECAYTILFALDHQDTEIILKEHRTTVRQIYAGTATGILAERIKFQFYGGPIGHGAWYAGTLYSFLVDCVAARIQLESFDKVRTLLRIKTRSGCLR